LRKENGILERKAASEMILTLLLISMLTLAFNIRQIKCSARVSHKTVALSVMWIEPQTINLSTETHSVGYEFNVTVWINLTETCGGWQFKMLYNKTQLNATGCGYTAGDKSQFFENLTTFSLDPMFRSHNATHDYVLHGETWFAGDFRNPGYGSLSWVEFEVMAAPPEGGILTSLLDISTCYHPPTSDTFAVDPDENEISLTIYDSTYRFSHYTHDITIVDVICSKTIVGQGFTVRVNVTTQNQGNYEETFNVTLYANTTIINKLTTIILTSGSSTTITFTWDTTGVAYGNYTISAYAHPVLNETDLTDNTYVNGWVVVTVPGDINGDFKVNHKDLLLLASAYGSEVEDAKYIPEADIDCSGKVDHKDLLILAANYGKET
jgi:hypothetical protein